MAKSTKKRAVIYSNVKENKKKSLQQNEIKQSQINLDEEVIIGINKPNIDEKYIEKKSTKKNNGSKKKKNVKSQVTKDKSTKKNIHKKNVTRNKPKVNSKNNVQQVKKIAIIIVICFSIIVGIFVFCKSSIFNIKDIFISVENNAVLTESDIKNLSNINVGKNLFSINKKEAIKGLQTNPYVESVKIKKIIPSKIQISIVERKVKFQLQSEQNEYIYIDKQGYAIDSSREKKDGLFIIGYKTENIQYGEKLCIEDLEGLTAVNQIIQECENNEFEGIITRIDISNHDDYILYFDNESKVAHLGDASALNSKIARIKKIMEIEHEYAGEIFVNVDINNGEYPYFREHV